MTTEHLYSDLKGTPHVKPPRMWSCEPNKQCWNSYFCTFKELLPQWVATAGGQIMTSTCQTSRCVLVRISPLPSLLIGSRRGCRGGLINRNWCLDRLRKELFKPHDVFELHLGSVVECRKENKTIPNTLWIMMPSDYRKVQSNQKTEDKVDENVPIRSLD